MPSRGDCIRQNLEAIEEEVLTLKSYFPTKPRRKPPAVEGDTQVFIGWDRLRGILKSAGEVLQDDTIVGFGYGHMGLEVSIKQDPEAERRINPYTKELQE